MIVLCTQLYCNARLCVGCHLLTTGVRLQNHDCSLRFEKSTQAFDDGEYAQGRCATRYSSSRNLTDMYKSCLYTDACLHQVMGFILRAWEGTSHLTSPVFCFTHIATNCKAIEASSQHYSLAMAIDTSVAPPPRLWKWPHRNKHELS